MKSKLERLTIAKAMLSTLIAYLIIWPLYYIEMLMYSRGVEFPFLLEAFFTRWILAIIFAFIMRKKYNVVFEDNKTFLIMLSATFFVLIFYFNGMAGDFFSDIYDFTNYEKVINNVPYEDFMLSDTLFDSLLNRQLIPFALFSSLIVSFKTKKSLKQAHA